jgi:PAS domain S-box-containing protein
MDLRLRVAVPAVIAAALTLLVLALAKQISLTFVTVTIALIGLGAIAALTRFAADKYFQQPLEQLVRRQMDLLRKSGIKLPAEQSNPVQGLEGLLSQAAEATVAHIDSLAQERETLKKMQQTLQESEERYELAVRGANDGLWEWDLKSNRMYLSPRWKGMLGYGEAEFPDTAEAWKARILPEDLANFESALQNHLSGTSSIFKSEHRMVHKDGGARWVMSRATAIRHANGTPYRMLGLDTETTNFKQIEEVLFHVARGTANATGEEFFRLMVRHFALAFRVHVVWIARCLDSPATRVSTVACWEAGNFTRKEYALDETPCKKVIQEGLPYFIPEELETLYPKPHRGMYSYLGIPIFDSRKKVLGHLVFKDNKKMENSILMDSVYQIFTARAGVEMERMEDQNILLQVVRGERLASDDLARLTVSRLSERQ